MTGPGDDLIPGHRRDGIDGMGWLEDDHFLTFAVISTPFNTIQSFRLCSKTLHRSVVPPRPAYTLLHLRKMTTYQLLFGGYRKTFTKVTFDPATAKLKIVSESPAPESASWLEKPGDKVKAATSNKVLYGLSETEQGVAYGLEAEKAGFKVTQKRETHGGPAHSKWDLSTTAEQADGSPLHEGRFGHRRRQCPSGLTMWHKRC